MGEIVGAFVPGQHRFLLSGAHVRRGKVKKVKVVGVEPNWTSHASTGSKSQPLIKNEMNKSNFSSRITTDWPLYESPAASFDLYLNDRPRVLEAIFPEKRTSQRLNEEEWRIQMQPVQLLFLTAWPVVNMRLRCKSQGKDYPIGVPLDTTRVLELDVTRWELKGLDSIIKPSHFKLGVRGVLYPYRNGVRSCLKGEFEMNISLVLPSMLVLVPEDVLRGALESVLKRFVENMKHKKLLSSSMDKTVRLWDMESKSCLKLFAHNDYVTCIQFNPVDDRYFISGSLDAKVRIWSIPNRQVVDWTDLHEMVTAVCYTPDGKGALIGSHKGGCRLYNTSDFKLHQKGRIDVQNKKKSHAKKITGFQFAPGNPSEVLITSADSRIRIFDGSDVIHKFRGFRNTSSQISASFTADGKYVVCASEDSQVYVWKRDEIRNVGEGKSKGLITTRSHERFQCRDVSVAIPWPGSIKYEPPLLFIRSKRHSKRRNPLPPPSPKILTFEEILMSDSSIRNSPHHPKNTSFSAELANTWHLDSGIGGSNSFASASTSCKYGDSPYISASGNSISSSLRWFDGSNSSRNQSIHATAWGMVIVTAGLGGEIRTYQNFGLPLRLSRQTNLFRDHT